MAWTYTTPTGHLLHKIPGCYSLYNGVNNYGFIDNGDNTAVLGCMENGLPLVIHPSDCPHLLIAGTTGSGKSVLMNDIILSLLYSTEPVKTKMIFIDPKGIEFQPYHDMPQIFNESIVTSTNGAVSVLNRLCSEMNLRYQYLLQKSNNENRTICSIEPCQNFPRVYVFIDELADLMLTNRKEIETPLVKLAQKGRAADIHLIIATQRPTVNVVTGLLKANIPARVALTCASSKDSITILDHGGAEKLRGKGDAIYKPGNAVDEIHFQSCYTSDEDIDSVCNYIRSIVPYEYSHPKEEKKSWWKTFLGI